MERLHGFRIFFAYDPAWRSLWAALTLKSTSGAIGGFGAILILRPSFPSIGAFQRERFLCRTGELIALLIVAELVWIQFWTDTSLLQRCFRIAFCNGSNQIDSAFCGLFDIGVLDVSTVDDHLPRCLSRIGLHSIHAFFQLIVIRARLRGLHGHNNLVRCFGADLDVVAGGKSSIGLLHHSGFWIALTHARCLVGRLSPFL